MNYQHLDTYNTTHLPEVRKLAETVLACMSRDAETDSLADPEDPVGQTFQRMVIAFMAAEGITNEALVSAMHSYKELGRLLVSA